MAKGGIIERFLEGLLDKTELIWWSMTARIGELNKEIIKHLKIDVILKDIESDCNSITDLLETGDKDKLREHLEQISESAYGLGIILNQATPDKLNTGLGNIYDEGEENEILTLLLKAIITTYLRNLALMGVGQ